MFCLIFLKDYSACSVESRLYWVKGLSRRQAFASNPSER